MQQYVVTLFYGVNGQHKGNDWDTLLFFKTDMPFVPTENTQVLIALTDPRGVDLLTIEEVHWNVAERRFDAYIHNNNFTWPHDPETFLSNCAKCGWREDPESKEERLAALADDEAALAEEDGGTPCP